MVLLCVLILTPLAGCNDNGTNSSPDNTAGITSTAPSGGNDGPIVSNDVDNEVYPLKGEDLELSVWAILIPNAGSLVSEYDNYPIMELAGKNTGVHIEWINNISATAAENLMISIVSEDYPDIYRGFTTTYNETGKYAEENGIIFRLNDLMEEYAPNYWSLINSTKETYRENTDEEGNIYAFNAYSDIYLPGEGLLIRQDWLDELNLTAPTTINELTEVLTAFRSTYDSSSTLMMNAGNWADTLTAGFNVSGLGELTFGGFYQESFYQENGVVKNSIIEDGMYDYISTMRGWYEAGLISSDFASVSGNVYGDQYNNLVINGDSGVFFGYTSLMASYADLAEDENFEVVGIADITVEGNSTTHFTDTSLLVKKYACVITTNCKNPEIAARWLDYWFSEEGMLLASYGEQGVSWDYVDGEPAFTGLVLNSDLELSSIQAANYYSIYRNITAQYMEGRVSQFYTDAQKEADKIWASSRDNKYVLPSLNLTESESGEYNRIMSDLYTFAVENLMYFIVGQRDLSEWDVFVASARNIGIDEAISIYQAAYNRYIGV